MSQTIHTTSSPNPLACSLLPSFHETTSPTSFTDSTQPQEKRRTRNTLQTTPNSPSPFDFSILTLEMVENIKALAKTCRRDWRKVSKKFFDVNRILIPAFELKTYFKVIEVPRTGNLKKKFSQEEDSTLLSAVEEVGKDWNLISTKYFNNLCPIALRNRFYLASREKKLEDKRKKKRDYMRKRRAKLSQSSCESEEIDLSMLVKDIIFEEQPDWLVIFEDYMQKFI